MPLLSRLVAGAACLVMIAGAGAPARAASEMREHAVSEIRVEPPMAQPIVGERLGFHGRWFGIPVGSGWIEVTGLIEYEGRQAYVIEAEGRTNTVLSTFYPIHDRVISYLDVATLRPLRFEKHQREGRYQADEVVTFDYGRRLATYRSLLNGSTKEIPLPEEFQDLISGLYWFRSQAIQPNQTVTANFYTDEKIFETVIRVGQPVMLELLKRGTFACLVIEPEATFKGLLVKRGRMWAYLSADARRLPLLVKATTPWGAMAAILDMDAIEAGQEALVGEQAGE